MNNHAHTATELEAVYTVLGELLDSINEAENATPWNKGMAAGVYVIRGMVHDRKERQWELAKTAFDQERYGLER